MVGIYKEGFFVIPKILQQPSGEEMRIRFSTYLLNPISNCVWILHLFREVACSDRWPYFSTF